MKLKVKKLHPDAKLPTYATDGSACFDIYAVMDNEAKAGILQGGAFYSVPTGLAVEIPKDWCLKLYSRSGHGKNYQVCLANGTGIIDSDYRDELQVVLINHGYKDFPIRNGDRIAQAMLVPVEKVEFEEVEELSQTSRLGGFGSTGA